MKLKIMIVFVLLISMTASGKNKDDKGKDKKEETKEVEWYKRFEGNKFQFYGNHSRIFNNKENLYEVYVFGDLKVISFISAYVQEGFSIDDGIKYDKIKIDREKKRVSFYKRNGWLIITLEFLDNIRFKIIDYGEWIFPSKSIRDFKWDTKDEFEKEILKEYHMTENFSKYQFFDESRIYECE